MNQDKKQEYGLPTGKVKKDFNRTFALIWICIIILISMSSMTQYIAHKLNYNSQLGGFNQIYWPWAWFFWENDLGEKLRQLFKEAKSIGFLVFTILFVFFATFMMLRQGRQKGIQNLHGSARFATKKEIENMGILENTGVYIGGWFNKKKKRT